MLDATDELLAGYRISDATWARLAPDLGRRQLLELVFVVGTYACLAMVFFRAIGTRPILRVRPFPPVLDGQTAMAPGATILHPAMWTQGTRSDEPTNVASRFRFVRGDVDGGPGE